MVQNYQRIGDYISVLDNRNADGSVKNLMGISIDKCYIPSVANVIGTDLHNYKVIRKGQFACSLMQVSRDQRIPIAMYEDDSPAIMSPAYVMFEVSRPDDILPEYMELWFKRAEFDREASFYAVGGVRGSLDWEDFCKMKLPVPSIDEQRKIVHDYYVVTQRIALLLQMKDNYEIQLSTLFVNDFCPLSFEMSGNSVLGEYLSFDNGYPFSSEDYTENGKYRIITIGNVNDGYLDTTKTNSINNVAEKVIQSTELFVGDVVISLTGNVGRTALITEKGLLLNQRVARIVPKDKNMLPFMYCLFRQQRTKDYLIGISKGTAQLNLSPVELLGTKIDYSYESIIKFSEIAKPFINCVISVLREIKMLKGIQELLLYNIK